MKKTQNGRGSPAQADLPIVNRCVNRLYPNKKRGEMVTVQRCNS